MTRSEFGAEGEDVALGDTADLFVGEVRQQVAIDGGAQHLDVRAA